MSYADQRAQLDRMVAAMRKTESDLGHALARIEHQAHSSARASTARKLQWGRGSSTWGRPDEARYQRTLASLEAAAARELGALRSRLERQDAAIVAYRRKHGVNDEITPQFGTEADRGQRARL